jgi:hypothetical protein
MQETPAVPPNYDPRVGATQILQKEHWDRVLYGIGQTFDAQGESFFDDVNRIKHKFLCSLKEIGRFSDKKEFHAYGIGLILEFGDPDLYELFHYNLMEYECEEATKFRCWASRLAAGGGVAGYDVNNGSFHLNWGAPLNSNLYWLSEPFIFSLDRTFSWLSTFSNEEVGGFNPLTDLNAADQVRKNMTLIMVGRELGDVANR